MNRKKEIYPSLILISLFILGVLVFSPTALAAEQKVLKFSHQWVKGDVRDNWARHFTSLVEKKN